MGLKSMAFLFLENMPSRFPFPPGGGKRQRKSRTTKMNYFKGEQYV
jgi:hypothetical protein